MFDWMKRKIPEPLVFRDNKDAFAYACRDQDNELQLDADIPALVEAKGKKGAEGEQYFLLRLASGDGGRELWGCTLKEATEFPEVGDFVIFKVVKIASELPAGMDVIGFIAAKLDPVLVRKKGWRVAISYTPVAIKSPIRF